MSENQEILRVIRVKPGLIARINGVAFELHDRGSISEPIDKPMFDHFLLLPGYEPAPKQVVVAPAPAPVAAPVAPAPGPVAAPEPPSAAPASAAQPDPAASAAGEQQNGAEVAQDGGKPAEAAKDPADAPAAAPRKGGRKSAADAPADEPKLV